MPNKEIIIESSLSDDSSYDSILEYLVFDGYDSRKTYFNDSRQNYGYRYHEFPDFQPSVGA